MNYAEKLIKKIEGYKSYDQRVKDRVIAQVNPNLNITEEKFKEILKRVPGVMKANKQFLQRYDRVRKEVTALERHSFAPELNTLWFKRGFGIKTAGCVEIEKAAVYIVNYEYKNFEAQMTHFKKK